MNGVTLFYMWEGHRNHLISLHRFHFEQARKLLLSPFENLEKLAEHETQEWLNRPGRFFDPDYDEVATYYEEAYEKSIEYYFLLESLLESTRLSVLTGVFVEMDKQLRKWVTDEILHWHEGTIVAQQVWNVDLLSLLELLECCGWQGRSETFFDKFNTCRLVVNVYKHGRGRSYDELIAAHPDYVGVSHQESADSSESLLHIDHTDLRVTEEQLHELSDSIVAFWQSFPARLLYSDGMEFPGWFARARNKDINLREEGVTP